MKSIKKIYWIAHRECIAMLLSGATLATTMLVVSFSAIYFFTLYDFFIKDQGHLLGFFEWIPLLLLWVVPTMSMGLVTEEKRSGHLELYLALPISYFSLLMGKWWGVYSTLMLLVLSTVSFAFCVDYISDLDWGPVYTAYLGLALNTALYLSIGLWASCFCEHQLSAWLLAFMTCLALYLIGYSAPFLPQDLAIWSQKLSIPHRLSRLNRGVIDSRDVIYFLTMIILYISMSLRQFRARIYQG
jgi:ABC-2 type transport system permease protein